MHMFYKNSYVNKLYVILSLCFKLFEPQTFSCNSFYVGYRPKAPATTYTSCLVLNASPNHQ